MERLIMTVYWITAHVEEKYIVEASNQKEAEEMVRTGMVYSRGEEIVEMTIDFIGDNND
jgi:hypothetical protein